jgi:hypothetical protein
MSSVVHALMKPPARNARLIPVAHMNNPFIYRGLGFGLALSGSLGLLAARFDLGSFFHLGLAHLFQCTRWPAHKLPHSIRHKQPFADFA